MKCVVELKITRKTPTRRRIISLRGSVLSCPKKIAVGAGYAAAFGVSGGCAVATRQCERGATKEDGGREEKGREGKAVMASWLDDRKGATWKNREIATIAEKVERGEREREKGEERGKGTESRTESRGWLTRTKGDGGGFIAGI
jgi:hypothetical protein